MRAGTKLSRRSDVALLGRGVLMVVRCAVGPAVVGAVAGSATGGWRGIACAVILAATAALAVGVELFAPDPRTAPSDDLSDSIASYPAVRDPLEEAQ